MKLYTKKTSIWGQSAPKIVPSAANAPVLGVSKPIASALQEGDIAAISVNALTAKIVKNSNQPKVRFLPLFC